MGLGGCGWWNLEGMGGRGLDRDTSRGQRGIGLGRGAISRRLGKEGMGLGGWGWWKQARGEW